MSICFFSCSPVRVLVLRLQVVYCGAQISARVGAYFLYVFGWEGKIFIF